MKYITDLLNEVNSIDVISEKYYFVGQVTISETDRIDQGIDKDSLKDFKSKMFLTLNKSNEADLKRLYNSAKTELISLSKDQLINARKTLLSYNYKHIFKKMSNFIVKVYEGKQHPADELEFRLFLNSNFICNIPESGAFSSYFLTNLVDEYSNKRGFISLLIDDINNLLKDGKSTFPPLTKDLNVKKQEYLYRELIRHNFISADECFNNFCFAIGGTTQIKESDYKKIKWLVRNRQCLRYLLTTIKHNTDADVSRAVSYYFVDCKGQAMKLPNDKEARYADEHKMLDILENMKNI